MPPILNISPLRIQIGSPIQIVPPKATTERPTRPSTTTDVFIRSTGPRAGIEGEGRVMLPSRPRPEPAYDFDGPPWTVGQGASEAAMAVLEAQRAPSLADANQILVTALGLQTAATRNNLVAHIGLRTVENMQTEQGRYDAASLALSHLAMGKETGGTAAYRLGRSIVAHFNTPEGRGRAALGVLSGIAEGTSNDGVRIAAQATYQASNHQTSWDGVERGVIAGLKYLELF